MGAPDNHGVGFRKTYTQLVGYSLFVRAVKVKVQDV